MIVFIRTIFQLNDLVCPSMDLIIEETTDTDMD